MKFERDDFFTGLFVIGGSVLAISTLLILLGYNVFSNRVHYILRMEKLAGVIKGTPIKLKHYTVGRVEEVYPIYGGNIYFKASVSIDRDLRLYRGTLINITKQNVIGDTILDLIPSIEKKQVLRPGDTLFASNIVNLDQMINQISGLVTNVSETVNVFGKLAGNSKGDVKRLFFEMNTALSKVNRVLTRSERSLYDTMRNIRKTSATLEKFSREISDNPLMLLKGKQQSYQQNQRGVLP